MMLIQCPVLSVHLYLYFLQVLLLVFCGHVCPLSACHRRQWVSCGIQREPAVEAIAATPVPNRFLVGRCGPFPLRLLLLKLQAPCLPLLLLQPHTLLQPPAPRLLLLLLQPRAGPDRCWSTRGVSGPPRTGA